MYAHYFPFFCFFLLIYTPYSYHAMKRGGTAPPHFVSFPFLTTSRLNLYPPLPRSNATCFAANGEGSTPSPFVFVHFDANREGSTPSPLFSTTALKNKQTRSFLRAVVVLKHLSWHHQRPPP